MPMLLMSWCMAAWSIAVWGACAAAVSGAAAGSAFPPRTWAGMPAATHRMATIPAQTVRRIRHPSMVFHASIDGTGEVALEFRALLVRGGTEHIVAGRCARR